MHAAVNILFKCTQHESVTDFELMGEEGRKNEKWVIYEEKERARE